MDVLGLRLNIELVLDHGYKNMLYLWKCVYFCNIKNISDFVVGNRPHVHTSGLSV